MANRFLSRKILYRYCHYLLFLFFLFSQPLHAASFTVTDGQTVGPQTLNAPNETGLVELGGTVTRNTAGSAVLVTPAATNASLTNNGSITGTGANSIAVTVGTAANVSVINNGSIFSAQSRALQFTSSNGTLTNNGIISTGAVGTEAVYMLNGTNMTFINNGTISTSRNDANSAAVRIESTNTTVNNTGTIFSSGFSAITGNNVATNLKIINSGTISTTGANDHAISLTGAGQTVTNSGTISATGAGAIALDLNSGGANSYTVTNSGTISATGNATQAIANGTGSVILNLHSGSKILGTIDLGAGTDTVNVLGLPEASSRITFTNADNITLAAGLPGVIIGNTVTTVDPSMQTVQVTALSTLTSAFHNVISQRMAHTQPLPPVQLASLELSPGMLFQERAPIAWGEFFGSHRDRGDDGLALAYTHNYKGFTGGYEQDYDQARVGLFAGFAVASAETDVTSLDTDTDSFFGGGYAHFYLGSVNLTTSFAVGVEDHENDRTVIDNLFGIETARSDFSSVFFSPSVTLSAAYKLNEYYEFRPSATLTYNVAWYDSYTETGTTRSNLSIDDRTDHALIGRLQLAMAVAPNETSEFEFRTGVITRYTDGDDTNASLAGTSFQYAATGDSTVPGAFVGGNLRFNITDKLDLTGDVEYTGASGDESDISARLRVEYFF